MADIANPDSDTPFVNAIETARKTIAAIHQHGINKIILLSHLGYDGDIALAEQVSGISLIVGGHSHVLQGDFSALGLGSQDEYGLKINHTYIVQAGFYALTLGHCQIDFAANGEVTRFEGRNELLLGRRMFVDASMSQEQISERYSQARDEVDNHPNVVVCKKILWCKVYCRRNTYPKCVNCNNKLSLMRIALYAICAYRMLKAAVRLPLWSRKHLCMH